MAGEIAQEVAVMLALSSAAIGASGAVISQVVAGVITGKREQRKADAEAERWKAEADAKRRDRQLDRKIELFSKFLSTVQEIYNSEMWWRDKIEAETKKSQLEAVAHLRRIAEEIGILAPELYEYAQSAYNAANEAVTGYLFIKMAGVDPAQEDGVSASAVTRAREAMLIWARHFQRETRSYVSHEPVTPHHDVLVTHKEDLKKALAES